MSESRLSQRIDTITVDRDYFAHLLEFASVLHYGIHLMNEEARQEILENADKVISKGREILYQSSHKEEVKSVRDTQFQGFAKLLFEELQAIEVEGLKNNWHQLDVYRRQREAIARRAYDFAFHVIDNSRSNDMEDWQTEQIMPYVPDMSELPKEQEA